MRSLRCLLRSNYTALAALIIGVALPAGAQIRCTVTSVPTAVRAEGLTELIGDIILTCTGGAPTPAGQSIPQANFAVALATTVTSRILSNGGSEALILIDEPGTASNPKQQVCSSLNGCVVTGTGGVAEPFDGSSGRPNAFQGVVSGNIVTFLGVPVDPPPPGSVRTYRITNVRANASALSGANTSMQILASVSVSGSTSLPLDQPVRVVGNVFSGLTFESGSVNALQCVPLDKSLAALVYDEGFPAAFKTRTIAGPDPSATTVQPTPGADYKSESGLTLAGLAGAGLADYGTRFKAVFHNLPKGVTLWVSTVNLEATDTSMAQMTATESGPFFPIQGTTKVDFFGNVAQVPIVNGTATVVWEVIATNPAATEEFTFPMFFDSATLDPKTSPATVNGSFAATAAATGSPTLAQPASFPVPRFVDTSTATNVLTVTACQTTLLFPYVTSQAGFDTGLAISNTSSDPLGTVTQAGVCTLSAYGQNAPQPVTTAVVASGTSYTTLASTLFPNFTGYVFAVCNFQYAHGFAFISDAGARNLAMGYLALVMVPGEDVLARPSITDAETLVH